MLKHLEWEHLLSNTQRNKHRAWASELSQCLVRDSWVVVNSEEGDMKDGEHAHPLPLLLAFACLSPLCRIFSLAWYLDHLHSLSEMQLQCHFLQEAL